ncbi:MAG: cytidine deaminase [Candidatus Edwardsbacteria bacterium]
MEEVSLKNYKRLVKAAKQAKKNAYTPYSKFRVGAAILTKKGTIYTGCNVENVSYGLTICAERVAVGKAISAAERDFVALALVSDSRHLITPCGACRQIISEFAPNLQIILINKSGKIKITNIKKLLPEPFKLDDKKE